MNYTKETEEIMKTVGDIFGKEFTSYSEMYDFLKKVDFATKKTKLYLSLPTVNGSDAEELSTAYNF